MARGGGQNSILAAAADPMDLCELAVHVRSSIEFVPCSGLALAGKEGTYLRYCFRAAARVGWKCDFSVSDDV